ncbi:SPFH domain-containing protein [Streptomyces sp. NPDC088261]|uniref:SPFH domain-containing protein n=1 Tax=Streptomyces sp. NPDC088261 TaxID=3365851 RepID=UPI0037FE34B1
MEHLAPARPLSPALHPIPGRELNAPAGIAPLATSAEEPGSRSVPPVPSSPEPDPEPAPRSVPPVAPAPAPPSAASPAPVPPSSSSPVGSAPVPPSSSSPVGSAPVPPSSSPPVGSAPVPPSSSSPVGSAPVPPSSSPPVAPAPVPTSSALAESPSAPRARVADDNVGAGDGVGGGEAGRWSGPVIVGESSHDIPVHLLFRDERDESGPSLPAAGARRMRRVPAPASGPVVPVRAAPPGDPRLVERPGPVLPGWVAVCAGLAALVACAVVVWWAGAVPDAVNTVLRLPSPAYHGIALGEWAVLALGVTVALFAFGGLGRGRVGQAWVLTLFGDYRGSVRRTGLLWVSPLLLRRKVDVRLRHWRSEPVPAVDANGTALRVVVLVVWRVKDTVRAALGVRDHEEYLREQVEAAMARVLSQLPADAFHDDAPTLRDAEAVGDALTRMLSAECRPVGVEVFSAQPTRIEYAPEIAEAMQRSRIAAIDARHRDSVLTSVVDAVDDTVHRLTSRGLVELDDYERKALVKDLTVAFYTGRQGAAERF